ncbi:hypothetical protein KTS45_17430 [Halomicroarcula limicola]|uniref:MarR family transcriptional regulator n=1 Tax=Haloarcula limicola TaxID=1429915 RepID=A0A8J7YGD1_9EURY|nr:ArsR family transcriptional regulator [Halomicroarcula limicola]MBV0925988.1 hypothetical protein [Halomicroarcula limicola]
MTQKSSGSEGQRASIEDLSPSAKLVYKTLQYEGELTQKQLVEKTALVQRTVRSAVHRLEAADEITSRTKLGDARQSVYSIADTSQETTTDQPEYVRTDAHSSR